MTLIICHINNISMQISNRNTWDSTELCQDHYCGKCPISQCWQILL